MPPYYVCWCRRPYSNIDCKSYGDYTIIGETIDDACGEAFDKVGKLLNLEYLVDQKFQNWQIVETPVGLNFKALTKDRNYNFSFSES